MRIYAIGDLHLSFREKVSPENLQTLEPYKPMDLFGTGWSRHFEKINDHWRRTVKDDDVVLLPGDLSWAMKPEEAIFDLDFVGQLPGTKVLVKGNHDYWWQAVGKVRRMLPPGVIALQNDHFAAGDIAVCGTRGWLCPGAREEKRAAGEAFDEHDFKIYRRELQRLELSLQSAVRAGFERIIVMLHFPPAANGKPDPGFMGLLYRYGVKECVYGHLHNVAGPVLTEAEGISFFLVACDYINFCPLFIFEYV